MATRTYFCERDNQNKIYTTTNKIERFFESQLPMHQYTETWYLMTVSEGAKERVEELIGRSIDQYRDADTGAYILGVGDCNDDTGLDIWLPGQDFAIDDLQGIDGVQIDEQCTFLGFFDTSDPNGGALIFGRYNGDDYLDCGYDAIDDEVLIKQLDEFIDDIREDDDNDSPYFTSYVSDKYPDWSCYSSHVDNQQWYDYCITIPETEEQKLDKKYSKEIDRLRYIRYQGVGEEAVRVFANHPYYKVRYMVARYFDASTEVLEKLSKDENELVRQGVAMNLNTPKQVLETLAYDKSKKVRGAVARNHKAPKKAFETLINDTEEDIRQVAKELMDRLAGLGYF